MSSQPRPEQAGYALTHSISSLAEDCYKKAGSTLGWNQLWGELVILIGVFGVVCSALKLHRTYIL